MSEKWKETFWHKLREFWSIWWHTRFMTKLLLFCLFLTGCIGGGFEPNKQPSGKIIVQPDIVYMKPDGWAFSYSPNMPKNPIPLSGSKDWYFDFPDKDGVHMVMVPYHANKPHKTLSITYRISAISGTPKFVSVDPGSGSPACWRPILERQGDMMVASQEFYRWWSTPTILIADGQTHTVSYSLTPDKWTAVFGKGNAAEFAATMKNLMGVGVTFGGDFAAHGDYVSGGKARFELINYAIQ